MRTAKRLMTAELEAKAQDAPRPLMPMRGIQVGRESSETTKAVLRKQATAAELAMLDAAIQARLAKEAAIWLRCDNSPCGFIGNFRASTKGEACLKCNWKAEKGGGHMQAMSAAAVAEHQQEEAAKNERARKASRAAGLAARNKEREAAGLPLLTPEQYEAEAGAANRARVEGERRMGEAYAQIELERRAKAKA